MVLSRIQYESVEPRVLWVSFAESLELPAPWTTHDREGSTSQWKGRKYWWSSPDAQHTDSVYQTEPIDWLLSRHELCRQAPVDLSQWGGGILGFSVACRRLPACWFLFLRPCWRFSRPESIASTDKVKTTKTREADGTEFWSEIGDWPTVSQVDHLSLCQWVANTMRIPNLGPVLRGWVSRRLQVCVDHPVAGLGLHTSWWGQRWGSTERLLSE